MLASYQAFTANIYTTRARMKGFGARVVVSTLRRVRPRAIIRVRSDGEQPFAIAFTLHGARDRDGPPWLQCVGLDAPRLCAFG